MALVHAGQESPPELSSRPDPASRATVLSVLRRATRFEEFGVLLVLILMIVVIGVLRPNFLTPSSIANLTQQVPLYGVMALGMVFLLSMREIDLSVGAIFGVCIVTAALLMQGGMDPWLSAAIGVGTGCVLGLVNGVLANVLQIPTIIVTLGTLSAFRGIALVISDGRSIGRLPRDSSFFQVLGGQWLGLPVAFWVFAALTVILTIVFRSSRFGLVVRAIGSNGRAAELSGIRIARTRLTALVLMGALCGVAGMLTLAFFQSGDSSLGTGYELLVIASAVIGGTGLSGGRGSVPGAFLGAIVLGVISSGLLQFGITANWTTFATGTVIVAAVALDYFVRRRRGLST
jgi:ribose transport system permease protein